MESLLFAEYEAADDVPICSVPECGRIVYAQERCRYHYDRYRRSDDFVRVRPNDGGVRPGQRINFQSLRLYAVVAMYAGLTSVKDVKAWNQEDAVERFLKTFPKYKVIGVGQLGGSGHPFKWLEEEE